MDVKPNRISAWIASAVLAAITLGVFYVVRDYGPESAIRRFQFAVLSRDTNALGAVTLQPLNDPSVQHLVTSVEMLTQRGANYQILQMNRGPDAVVAAVQYTLSNGESAPTYWVVVKQNRTWKVDTLETGLYFRKTLGL